jgi:hypothetical protein
VIALATLLAAAVAAELAPGPAAVAEPTAAAVALPAPAPPQPRDYAEPPAGLAADQQLWRDLRDATNDAVTGLGRIAQCSFRIDYGGYYQRLDLAARQEAARAEATSVRSALTKAASAADASKLPPPRNPSVRECREVLVSLDTAMPLHADRTVAPRLAKARAEARRCVKVVRPFADRAAARATALEAALAEVDRFVPGPPPAAATVTPAAAPARAEAKPSASPAAGAGSTAPPAPAPAVKP